MKLGLTQTFHTGTSLCALPTEEADAINTRIGAKKNFNGQYIVDCDKISTLPALMLKFGDREFTLEGKDYVLQVSGGPIGGGNQCVSGFMGLDVSQKLTLCSKHRNSNFF